MLMRALYITSVAQGVTGTAIERLLASSRRRNRQLDLTGAVVVCGRRFAQVLEEREESVTEMMAKIGAYGCLFATLCRQQGLRESRA